MRLPLILALLPLLGPIAAATPGPAPGVPASVPAQPDPPPAAPGTIPVIPLVRVVPKGEMRGIAFFAYLYPDCTSQGPIVVRVLEPAKHGKVAFVETDSFPRFAPGSPLATCNAKKVPGLRMTYETEEGFEGLDTYRILTINPDGLAAEYEVRVSVR